MCTNSVGFDFRTLWEVTQRYFMTCPDGPWLFKQSIAHVTLEKASLTGFYLQDHLRVRDGRNTVVETFGSD